MIDGDLRKLFRQNLPKPAWFWTSVESGGTLSGIPDSHWLNAEHDVAGWVEYKQTRAWQVDLRPHQIAWLTQHARHGVRCTVAVRARGLGSSQGAGDGLVLCAGAAAAQLAASGLPRGPDAAVLGAWYGPPRDWDWEAVARLLLSSS